MADSAHNRLPDWEAFYRDYRKPGYVPGFEITSKLGGGQFGLVFRACKESIGKDYAIKFLQVEDSEVREAVLRELEQVRHFAQIDHQNLVAIEDRGEVDGIPYLVMQYAGSATLRDRLAVDVSPGGPPQGVVREELMHFFLQACRGTAALHEHSLVHFDIKPANVFLKGSIARVGDYGLSKLVTHSRGSLSMGRGTPYYMAPEMLQRRGDHRSDIYSLGVMLYEILCGRLPFLGDSEWEVLRKHETEAPQWPAHLSAVERAVLQRCLQKDPAARFQSVHDVIASLVPCVSRVGGAVPASVAASPAEVARGQSTPAGEVEDLPPCVPPPLPRQARRKPKPKSKKASVFSVLPAALALLAVFFVVTGNDGRARVRNGARSDDALAAQRSAARSVPAPTTLSGRVDEFVIGTQRNVLAAVKKKRKTSLCQLSFAKLAAPRDMPAYVRMVEALAEAPTFSEGHATKLARYGRPVFLAAVAALQQYDYEDADDCRCAGHTIGLLVHMTQLPGMKTEAPICEPTRADTCRLQVHADAWRRFAEQFAASDADFAALLAQKARGRSNGD